MMIASALGLFACARPCIGGIDTIAIFDADDADHAFPLPHGRHAGGHDRRVSHERGVMRGLGD